MSNHQCEICQKKIDEPVLKLDDEEPLILDQAHEEKIVLFETALGNQDEITG